MTAYQDWMVQNVQRKYPLDDSATATADTGELLPEGFLIEANISIPKYEYSPGVVLGYVYISSASVSPGLISMTLLGSHLPAMPVSDPAPITSELFIPLAVISLPRPIQAYRNYPITPLLAGVSGWVTFGPTVLEDQSFSYLFTQPRQAMLAPRAVRAYTASPIQYVGISGSSAQLSGDVGLSNLYPLRIDVENVTLSPSMDVVEAIVFSLEETEDVLTSYCGTCGKRPESKTCNQTPIISVSGVTPDCSGNLNLVVADITTAWDANGFCFNSDVAVSDVCNQNNDLPDASGILKSEYAWSLPCDKATPYTAPLTAASLLDEFSPTLGYWEADGNRVRGFPPQGGQIGLIGTCIQTYGGTGTRTITATYTLAGTMAAGIFVCSNGLYRIISRSTDGKLVKQYTYDSTLDVIIGSASATSLAIQNSIIGGVTLIPGDPFWQPSGACGIWIQGSGYIDITLFKIMDS